METEKNKIDELNNEENPLTTEEKYLNDQLELLIMRKNKILRERKVKIFLLVIILAFCTFILLPKISELPFDMSLTLLNLMISLFLGVYSFNIGGSLKEIDKQIFDLVSSHENIKNENLRKKIKKEYDAIVNAAYGYNKKIGKNLLLIEKIMLLFAISIVIFMAILSYPCIYDYLKKYFILIVLFLMVIIVILISIVIYLILKKD